MKPICRILLATCILLTVKTNAQQVYEADNGITASGSSTTRKVSLGGTLTGNTTIPLGGFNLAFTGTGNIGINTSSPSSILHVNGTYTQTHPTNAGTLTIEHAGNNSIRFVNTGTGEFMRVGPANIVDFQGQVVKSVSRGAWFSASVAGANALLVESGKILLNTVAGNTMIGTTTDDGSNKLQVNGTVKATGLIITTSPGAGKVLTSDATGNATWQTVAAADNAWAKTGNVFGAVSKLGNTDNYGLRIVTNDLSRIYVSADGNVGIGTESVTGSYKLSVEGHVRARKVRVELNSWADYVFNDDYRLRPLHEVEKFINDNKHLPDVPSAETVKKEGIDLGDNQTILLKKIEELTLYIIDQNKRLEEQEKRLKLLEKEVSKKN